MVARAEKIKSPYIKADKLTAQDVKKIRTRAFNAIKLLSSEDAKAVAFVMGRAFGEGFYKGLEVGRKARTNE